MADLSQPLQHGTTEASIDQVNQWMRSTPWYQQQLQAWGQDPGHPTLNKQQSAQILKMAQANGVKVNEGDVELDNHGNFNPKGHKLRNTLIVAGLAGAAIAAPYIIPALTSGGGAAAPGAAAALSGSGAAASGIGAGTAAGIAGGAAIPASLGGALVPTIAPGLASLSAGSMIPAGAALTTGGTLGTAAKIGGLLSGGKGATGYLNTAGQVAGMLGDYSQGRASGRVAEADMALAQDRAAMDRYRAEMDAKKFALDAPGRRATNSVRGDILANARDASIGLPSTIPRTTISGGLRPSMFSDATRQLGAGMSKDALAGQQAGADVLAPPTPTAMPQAGRLDSILNTAGAIGSLASAIPYKKPGRIPQPGDSDYYPPTPQRR